MKMTYLLVGSKRDNTMRLFSPSKEVPHSFSADLYEAATNLDNFAESDSQSDSWSSVEYEGTPSVFSSEFRRSFSVVESTVSSLSEAQLAQKLATLTGVKSPQHGTPRSHSQSAPSTPSVHPMTGSNSSGVITAEKGPLDKGSGSGTGKGDLQVRSTPLESKPGMIKNQSTPSSLFDLIL